MVFGQTRPRQSMQQLRDEMDRLLSGFFGDLQRSAASSGDAPPINAWESGDNLFVELEVPGVKSDQVDISIVGGELAVRVDRPDVQSSEVTYHRRERPVGTFSRTVGLPVEVDPERVEASLEAGVLTITLPKAEAARPHKIPVRRG